MLSVKEDTMMAVPMMFCGGGREDLRQSPDFAAFVRFDFIRSLESQLSWV